MQSHLSPYFLSLCPRQRIIPKIFDEEGGGGEEKGDIARMVSSHPLCVSVRLCVCIYIYIFLIHTP